MTYTNEILKSILEIIGDPVATGYKFNDIPVLLNKDDTTTYPEIRLSPFIKKGVVDYQRFMDEDLTKYRQYEQGVCQIDIFSKSVIEAQNIYDELTHRLYDFFNLETVIYNWSPGFKEIDDNLYKNIDYALTGELFKDIYSVQVCGTKLQRVFCYDDLTKETWYVDEDALYIYTEQNLKKIDIKVLLQGKLFFNGDSFSDRGLHFYRIADVRNLSHLEHNEVERISFDVLILYSHKRQRESIPQVKRIRYPNRQVR